MAYGNGQNELYHHGIKGMKWGRRRYQNADGSLTPAGQKRYSRDAKEKNWTMGDDGLARSGGKKNRKVENPDADRWVREDLTRTQKVANSTKDFTRELNNLNKTAATISSKRKKQRMDLSSMSDKELRDRINRELLERQYNDVFSPATTSKGREFASDLLEVSGTVLATTASALGIALAIKELKG